MVCNQGDVITISFDPTLGHEPRKRRPALVVSADDFNFNSSMTVVVPITSRDNGYPLHIKLAGYDDFSGWACVEQMRAVDLGPRRAEHLGRISDDDLSCVLNVVGAVFGI